MEGREETLPVALAEEQVPAKPLDRSQLQDVGGLATRAKALGCPLHVVLKAGFEVVHGVAHVESVLDAEVPADQAPHVHHGLAVLARQWAHGHLSLHDRQADRGEAQLHLAQVVLRQRDALAGLEREQALAAAAGVAVHAADGVDALPRPGLWIIERVAEPVMQEEGRSSVAAAGRQRTLRIACVEQDLCKSRDGEPLQQRSRQREERSAKVLRPQRLALAHEFPVHPSGFRQLLHVVHFG
mmetsp:Transcript_94443/g.281912  ORF Transcript_94443/g.281912 Transcript_94443/m.281912 type:complete len:241 (-) Transcript_94443:236-958(-)